MLDPYAITLQRNTAAIDDNTIIDSDWDTLAAASEPAGDPTYQLGNGNRRIEPAPRYGE